MKIDNYSFENQANLIRAFNSFRKIFLNKKPHIKEYNKIRKLHGEIVGTMVKYYQDGKYIHKTSKASIASISRSKKDLTVYSYESSFDLDTRLGAQSFYDVFIYKTSSNASCITEDFIQSNRYKKLEKMEFLRSMLNSCIGLFEITGIDTDEGYAYLKEVFTGKEFKITDIGLSGQENYSDIYVYTRIITYHGVSFGTGLSLAFKKTDRFIKNHIQEYKKNYTPNGEFHRFMQLYHYLVDSPKNDMVVELS